MSVIGGNGNLDILEHSLTKLLCDIRGAQKGDIPTAINVGDAPTIDDWSYGLIPAQCLAGFVRQHPALGNHTPIHTSQLLFIDPTRSWARTWSRYYRLGAQKQMARGNRHCN
jgi:hypothetical protein